MRDSVLFGFVVAVLVLEIGARILAPHIPGQLTWDTQFTQDKAERIDEIGEVDVVLIGSSVVNAGIDPGALVANSRFTSAYNTAIPSTTPSTWKVWARDIVLPDLCPEVVVIGISIRDYSDNNVGIPNDLRSYLPSAGRLALYGRFTSGSLEERIGRFSTFVEIRSRVREPHNVARYILRGRTPGWPFTVLTDDGRFQGFDNNTYLLLTQEASDALATRVFVDFSVGGREDQATRAIIEDAQTLGMEVVIVFTPTMHDDLTPALPSGRDDVETFERAVRQLGEDYAIEVLSYPDMNDRSEFFSDVYHLNINGTNEFSQRLAADLSQVVPTTVERTCGVRPADPAEAAQP